MNQNNSIYSKPLVLILKKKWFDLIKKGEKTEEYRELKKYWKQRFINKSNEIDKKWDIVEFRNGYSRNAQTIRMELKDIEIRKGDKRYGAPNKPCFVLTLGKKIDEGNLSRFNYEKIRKEEMTIELECIIKELDDNKTFVDTVELMRRAQRLNKRMNTDKSENLKNKLELKVDKIIADYKYPKLFKI